MATLPKSRLFYPGPQSIPAAPPPGSIKAPPRSIVGSFAPTFQLSAGIPAAGMPTTGLTGRTLASGEAWWFVLGDVQVGTGSNLPDSFAIGTIRAVQGSCDVKGVGFANSAGARTVWGDIFGQGAALVAMVNPPLRERIGTGNVYRGSNLGLPGLESAAQPNPAFVGGEGDNILWWDTFPPGSMGDGTNQNPNKRTIVENFGQYPRAVRSGDRLVVAFVMIPNATTPPAGLALEGIAHITMTCGKVTQNDPFAGKPR